MTSSPQPQVEGRRLEGARQHLNQLLKDLTRLAEQELPASDFYGPLLQGLLGSLAAPAGAVWGRTPQGNLALQYQINFRQVGLDEDEEGRRDHDELLRQAVQQARPFHVPPRSSGATGADGRPESRNTSDFLLLVAPIRVDEQVVGLLEVWQRPDAPAGAVPGYMSFLQVMADVASLYHRNQQRRRMASQEQVWTQLEAFALQVQGSLNPTEVAYHVANEGRRLVGCDRLSVATRQGKRITVEAISGVDVIHKSSPQVRLLRALCREVLHFGERLVFAGVQDASLPPGVLRALDAYLAESAAKLLVVLPLRDPREEESNRPARSLLVMEAFEPDVTPDQLIGRLEVVGKHAARPLYNAAEFRRIPMSWLWRPLARVQEGLGGKGRALVIVAAALVAALVACLVLVPYPLKMEAKGQLLPEERRWIYSPVEGHILDFAEGVQPGSHVEKNQPLVLMYDLQLDLKLNQLAAEVNGAEEEIAALAGQLNAAATEAERRKILAEKRQKELIRDGKQEELRTMRRRTQGDEGQPGRFWLKSPLTGTVLSWDFRENLKNRYVKPSDPILRIGNKEHAWEIELKIPQRNIGQVLKAFDPKDPKAELDVDLLLMSAPTRIFKGKLARSKIAGEASPSREEGPDAEPVVLASVRIDGPGIAPEDRLPRALLTAGTEVHSKIRCSERALGYAWFYGVWEFLYDKVVFAM